MKTISIPASILILSVVFSSLISCETETKPEETTTFQIDSAFAAQQKALAEATEVRNDSLKSEGLPPVFEGDLIFQISKNEKAKALQLASSSKYSNVGMIFLSPRTGQLMVVDALDSIHATELNKWISNGEGEHFAVMRLKNSNRILGEGKTKKLKQKVKDLKQVPYDPYFSWDNGALYSTEFIWKLYSKVLYIDLCEPGKLKNFNLSSPQVKNQIGDKYAKGVSDTIKAVGPGDIYHSEKLDLIFER